MKKSLLFLFAAAALMAAGCSHKEYDLSDGVNTEITLFEKGITIPVGNIGPITLNDLLGRLGNNPLLSMVKDYLPAPDEDGFMCITMQNQVIHTINVLEIDQNITEKDKPYVYDFGTLDTSGPLAVTLLGAFGFAFPQQQVSFAVAHPVRATLPVTGKALFSYMDSETYESVPIAESVLDGTSLPRSRSDEEFLRLEAPDGIYAGASSIALENLKVELPANLMDKLYSSGKDIVFSVSYKSYLGIAPKMNIPMEEFPIKFSLPLGRFDLKKASVTMNVVNSLPLRVEVTDAWALDEDGSVLAAILIGKDIVIHGGLADSPAVSPVTLEIEAVEGRIPDLYGLQLSLAITAEPSLPIKPIRGDQGISLESANATLSGGITINKVL